MQESDLSSVVIQTHNLSRTYGKQKAVDNLNLAVRKGEIYGFLEQNGAGKTTTIRMLLGLVKPTSGVAKLFGETITPSAQDVFKRVGTLVEHPNFYYDLTVYDNLDIHRRMFGVRNKQTVDEVIVLLNLSSHRHKKAGALSTGLKQRLGLCLALLHKPELLILDEPLNGLDPVGIREVRNLLKDLAMKSDVTIFVSSHILSEVQLLCTKIGVINEGLLVEEISVDDFAKNSIKYLELHVTSPQKAMELLKEKFGLFGLSAEERQIIRAYDVNSSISEEINRALVENGIKVTNMHLKQETLEDHYIKVVENSSRTRQRSLAQDKSMRA